MSYNTQIFYNIYSSSRTSRQCESANSNVQQYSRVLDSTETTKWRDHEVHCLRKAQQGNLLFNNILIV